MRFSSFVLLNPSTQEVSVYFLTKVCLSYSCELLNILRFQLDWLTIVNQHILLVTLLILLKWNPSDKKLVTVFRIFMLNLSRTLMLLALLAPYGQF